MILLPARTSQIVRLLLNSHSFSSRTLWKLYTRMWRGQRWSKFWHLFCWGSLEREKDLHWVIAPSRLCKEHWSSADYVRNIEVPTSLTSSLSRCSFGGVITPYSPLKEQPWVYQPMTFFPKSENDTLLSPFVCLQVDLVSLFWPIQYFEVQYVHRTSGIWLHNVWIGESCDVVPIFQVQELQHYPRGFWCAFVQFLTIQSKKRYIFPW